MAKSLVELHGGSIEARSSGKDSGSEFVVRLPWKTTPADVNGGAAPQSTQVRRRVLIADDNEDSAVSLSMLLDSMGHETNIVHDGMAAIEAAESFRPEVVILDIDMPKLNGYQVARILKGRPWAQAALLVAMTGWAQESDREPGRLAGFTLTFSSPSVSMHFRP